MNLETSNTGHSGRAAHNLEPGRCRDGLDWPTVRLPPYTLPPHLQAPESAWHAHLARPQELQLRITCAKLTRHEATRLPSKLSRCGSDRFRWACSQDAAHPRMGVPSRSTVHRRDLVEQCSHPIFIANIARKTASEARLHGSGRLMVHLPATADKLRKRMRLPILAAKSYGTQCERTSDCRLRARLGPGSPQEPL